MKLSTGILAIATGALSSIAAAQSVSATKTGPLQTILPDLYGNVEVRHATFRVMDGDDVTSITPVLSIRPQIGTTLANGKLDTSFTWVFVKKPENATLRRHGSYPIYNETSYSLIKDSAGSFVNAYAYTEMPQAGDYSISEVGFDSKYLKNVDTLIGQLEFSAVETPIVRLYSGKASKDSKVTATRSDRNSNLLLADEVTAPAIERREPDLVIDTQLGVKLKPSDVKGLTVGFASQVYRNFEAKYSYDVNVDGQAENVEKDGYLSKTFVVNKYSVSYALNDKITLTNTLRQSVDGFYQGRLNSGSYWGQQGLPRWENRLTLAAPLF